MKNRSTTRGELMMVLPALKAKMLQESSYESVYVVQNGKFRFVNPNFAAMGKYEEQEMLGMETLRLVHPDDRLAARENAIKMLKGERPTPYQFRIVAKDGSVKWSFDLMKERIRSTHVHDNNGLDDVHLFPTLAQGGTTDWKRTMELLRSRPAQYPLLLELRETPEFPQPIESARRVFEALESL